MFGLGGAELVVLLALVPVTIVYFIPTIAAYRRKHPNRVAITFVNIFLGATIVGWIAALAWAVSRFEIPKGAAAE